MKQKKIDAREEEYKKLDRAAHDPTDIRPLSPRMRKIWEAAKRAGDIRGRGRPRKDPRLKSRIIPVSIDPALLAAVDRYAKKNGITRSGLIAQALKSRLKG